MEGSEDLFEQVPLPTTVDSTSNLQSVPYTGMVDPPHSVKEESCDDPEFMFRNYVELSDDDDRDEEPALHSTVDPTDRASSSREDKSNRNANSNTALPKTQENNKETTNVKSTLPGHSPTNECQTKQGEEVSGPPRRRYNNNLVQGFNAQSGQYEAYEMREEWTHRIKAEASVDAAKAKPNKRSHESLAPNDHGQSHAKKVKPTLEDAQRSPTKPKPIEPWTTKQLGERMWYIGFGLAQMATANIRDFEYALFLLENYNPQKAVQFAAEARNTDRAASILNARRWFGDNRWPGTEHVNFDQPSTALQRIQSRSASQAPTFPPPNMAPNQPHQGFQSQSQFQQGSPFGNTSNAQRPSVSSFQDSPYQTSTQSQAHSQQSSPFVSGPKAQQPSVSNFQDSTYKTTSQNQAHSQQGSQPGYEPKAQRPSVPNFQNPPHRTTSQNQAQSQQGSQPRYNPKAQRPSVPNFQNPPHRTTSQNQADHQQTSQSASVPQAKVPLVPQKTTDPSMRDSRPCSEQVAHEKGNSTKSKRQKSSHRQAQPQPSNQSFSNNQPFSNQVFDPNNQHLYPNNQPMNPSMQHFANNQPMNPSMQYFANNQPMNPNMQHFANNQPMNPSMQHFANNQPMDPSMQHFANSQPSNPSMQQHFANSQPSNPSMQQFANSQPFNPGTQAFIPSNQPFTSNQGFDLSNLQSYPNNTFFDPNEFSSNNGWN